MAIHLITNDPESVLEKLEQQIHQADLRWGVDRENTYFQRSRDSGLPYYFRYRLRKDAIEFSFMDVHNEYAMHYVNEYSGELIAVVLNIFNGDARLIHLKVEPAQG